MGSLFAPLRGQAHTDGETPHIQHGQALLPHEPAGASQAGAGPDDTGPAGTSPAEGAPLRRARLRREPL